MKLFYLNLIRHRVCACARHRLQLDLAKAIGARKQCGFSLVELVVVIALLSIVALASTSLIIDNGDLKRQLETEARWNQIHDAIISPPNLYLNGSPYVRGYVADMGRLPVSIAELISQAPTYDHDDDDATAEILIPYDEDGNPSTGDISSDQPVWQPINLGYTASSPTSTPPNADGLTYVAEIQGGWRGPYLYTAGSRQFRDGWGRESDLGLAEDSVNFGWNVITGLDDTDRQPITQVTDLIIQSFGSNRDSGGTGDFTEDFPVDASQTIIRENEWMLSASPITFNINFSNAIRNAVVGTSPVTLPPTVPPPTGGDPQELELRVYRYVDNGDNVADINDLMVVSADALFTVSNGASAASTTITPPIVDLVAIPPEGMPIGRYAALIWCTQNDNDPLIPTSFDNDTVYDGDCDGDPVEHSPVYFTLTNNTSQVTLTWDLP